MTLLWYIIKIRKQPFKIAIGYTLPMEQHLLFYLHPSSSINDALKELEHAHFSNIYYIEDKTTQRTSIGGRGKQSSLFEHVIFEKVVEDSIDWQAQWAAFSPDFRNDAVHLDLSSNTSPLLLSPGPGFGDLSHPTTRLVLKLMTAHLKDATVIDIGCGSGILSLAAIRLGATRAVGLDIDPQAITHARHNATLNHLEDRTFFVHELHEKLLAPNPTLLILMNMISSEQMHAWKAYPLLHRQTALIITSGIQASEHKSYLNFAQKCNWQLLEESEESEWLGFCFIQKTETVSRK